MKALSIRQPWAELIVRGAKDVENRTWRTSYRGSLLIHAARAVDRGLEQSASREAERAGLPWPRELRHGGIVGVVQLVDCVEDHPSDWFDGPWGWVLEEPRTLAFVPLRGRLGLFDVPDDMVDWTTAQETGET